MRTKINVAGIMPMVMMLCSMWSFTSCNNEESLGETSNSQNVKTVWVANGEIFENQTRATQDDAVPALCFKDKTSLRLFKEQLQNMTDEEKMKVIGKYGIKNPHNIANIADDELEKIGEETHNESEFKALYNQYVEKYKGILIRNTIDPTDYSLYVPDEDNMETFICNQQGVYVVGNEIQKADVSNQLSESTQKAARALMGNNTLAATSDGTNTLVYRPRSNLKIYFEAYMPNIYLWVKMYAQKHMWYGWKNDPNRKYYFHSDISMNFAYLAKGQYGQDVIVSPLPLYCFERNVKNGFNIILGKITSGNRLTGNFMIWSDNDTEYDADGKQITEVVGGMVVPKCLPEKAHNVKLDLTLPN